MSEEPVIPELTSVPITIRNGKIIMVRGKVWMCSDGKWHRWP